MSGVVLPPIVWKPSPNHSTRGGVTPRLLVWHETAGPYAGSVSWLRNPRSRASAHLVIREDGGEVSQLVALSQKAWTQGEFNPEGVGVEHANVTAKGYATEAQLEVSARVFGWLCLHLDIPPRWARHGQGRGVCFHGELPQKVDPHPNCGPTPEAWERFLVMLHYEIARGGYRKAWAR